MKKLIWLSRVAVIVLISLLLISLAGCLQDTFSRSEKQGTEQEQHLNPEQEYQNAVEERRRREAELREELGLFLCLCRLWTEQIILRLKQKEFM